MTASTTKWGRKAADLYQPAYARRYRNHDDELPSGEVYAEFSIWLRRACEMFAKPIDVLDLGCGTGRYFNVLTNTRTIVGIDASPAMLDEARRPLNAERVTAGVELIEGDFLTYDFGPERFDLVYSVGVLAEHSPLDEHVVSRVARWLKPAGRFAFTTVHPDSASIPATWGRSIGRAVVPLVPPPARSWLRRRLLADGLYADERRVRDLLEPTFAIESLTRMQSEAHLHTLCVARKNRG